MLTHHNQIFQTFHHHATDVVRKLTTIPIRVCPTHHALGHSPQRPAAYFSAS